MYIETARSGQNDWWRYLASLLIIGGAYLFGQLPLTIVILSKTGFDEHTVEFLKTLDFETIGIHPLLGFSLLILMFIFVFFAIILAVTQIHKRPLRTLLTAYSKFDWNKVLFAAGVMFLLLVINEGIFYFIDPSNYEVNATLTMALPLALVALFLLPFQISAEEFLLRGYLLQGFGLLFRYGWIAVLLTSVIFGSLHYQNPEVREFGLIQSMTYYIGFGVFMGILVLMSNGLELALGIHFIVNFYSIVLVTYPSSAMKTPALFRIVEYRSSDLLVSFFVTAIVFLIIAAIRYKWYDWGKIFERVKIEQ
jgi:uncharacterized protein